MTRVLTARFSRHGTVPPTARPVGRIRLRPDRMRRHLVRGVRSADTFIPADADLDEAVRAWDQLRARLDLTLGVGLLAHITGSEEPDLWARGLRRLTLEVETPPPGARRSRDGVWTLPVPVAGPTAPPPALTADQQAWVDRISGR